MSKQYKHLSLEERITLNELYTSGISVSDIANKLGYHQATIYRELKRGNTNDGYDPEQSEEQYQKTLHEKGPTRILEEHKDLALLISECILKKHLSPKKIAQQLKEDVRFKDITISGQTIYSAIDAGIIPNVSRKDFKKDCVKVFSGGQIIIPAHIRDECNINDGDVLNFEITSDGIILKKKKSQQ